MQQRRSRVLLSGFMAVWIGLGSGVSAQDKVDRRDAIESKEQFIIGPIETYRFQKFSDRYSATLEILDNGEVFRPGIIRIQENRTGATVIEVKSDELVLDTKDGQVKTNVHELPYGEQSLIISDDFNFDGVPDLAVMDGQFSCYHGPSYQVYLATATGLEHNEELTTLAQENCGFFEVDSDTRTLATMVKSGCCWHAFSTYAYVNGKLEEVRHVEEGAMSNASHMIDISGWDTKNGKRVSFSRREWVGEQDDELSVLMSFVLSPSGKRVVLYADKSGGPLFYTALQGNEVALLYPHDDEVGAFTYIAASDRLSFQSGDTTYTVIGPKGTGGLHMEVTARGKTSVLKVEADSLKGSLTALTEAGLKNLELR